MKIFNAFIILPVLIAGMFFSTWCAAPVSAEEKWGGIDEAVIERFAEEMGRTPSDPIINTDQGDILLFMFLIFGTIGGFIAGYYYRELFPNKKKEGGS